ncbi:Cation efflux protein cytoplasmic domain superfamily [Arabidopsis suecica]|uniref:Cation efflux protein cytoplasmic domain superfamily n=1 Tax=Arabidopsis suecica TaxID=45249 RepID=A0A8T1XCS1_ARASU|nr:Cation efflux protein cytoplasmic domain superfamily [Arabidopsis suecica]
MGIRFQMLNPRICRSRLLSCRDLPSSPLRLSQNPSFGFDFSRRWHFGHPDHRPGQEGEKIFRLGLTADIGLSVAKALTGYLCGSTAIIADAAHSVSDVVLSGVALVSYRAAKVPKDKEHPYGHGKFETLGALGISAMLLATGSGIAWHALDLLSIALSAAPEVLHDHGGHHHGIDMNHPILALTVIIASISVKEGLYWITKRAGEKQGSGLMMANAWHHRSDAISSVVALVGVGGSMFGVNFLDPLAGLVVSIMIFDAGLKTGHRSILELVDAAIPAQQLEPIRQTILQVEGVKGCHRLRGRRAGSSLYLDVHIVVDPFSSVSVAHELGEYVRRQINMNHPEVSEVFIHIDPAFLQFSCSTMDHDSITKSNQESNICQEIKHVEATVSDIFLSQLSEKMTIKRITTHLLHSKILLQIVVAMPSTMTIQDVMRAAEHAEKEILKAAPKVARVSIQLILNSE